MPKMKTKKSAAKRFTVQGSGGIKRSRAFLRHILTKKTAKRKRQLDMGRMVSKADQKAVAAMLPYA